MERNGLKGFQNLFHVPSARTRDVLAVAIKDVVLDGKNLTDVVCGKVGAHTLRHSADDHVGVEEPQHTVVNGLGNRLQCLKTGFEVFERHGLKAAGCTELRKVQRIHR